MSSQNYFKGMRVETELCEIFQKYIEQKNGTKTFLQKRPSTNAHMDFIGREYDPKTNNTLKELVLEVRTLNYIKDELNENYNGYIQFPSEKLNECMKFWRM